MTATWFEGDEPSDDSGSVNDFDITSTPNDFNISTLFNLIENGVIQIPPFQRNYVWDEKRASKLIESIILGLPVPQIFLYEIGKNKFYVIDGQQRLLSIYFFIKQRFPTKKGKDALREMMNGKQGIENSFLADETFFNNFALKLPNLADEEENKLNKKRFDTLGDNKYTFEILRTIRTVVIKQNEPDNDSSIYEIFSRLNTGGKNLSPQEIRMSLYFSDFYIMLMELNKNTTWRALLNKEIPDNRLKDVEILMRVFSMLISENEYSAPMGKFINTASKKVREFNSEKIEYCKNLFLSFLESCSNLPQNCFCSSKGTFVISLFEAVFVGVCKEYFHNSTYVESKIDARSIDDLKNNDSFKQLSQEGIASATRVKSRIKIAKDTIKFEQG